MNKRRACVLIVIATAAVVLAGGLMASNMGFKINYSLQAQQGGVSNSGFQTIGLPYHRQTGIDTAGDLLADIQAGGVSAASLQRFNCLSGQNDPYPGPAGNCPLQAAEGYLLGVQSSGPYIIVGSHDPSFEVRFKGPECAAGSGFQRYAHPYHAVSETAGEFLAEIAPQGASMQRYNILSDQNDPYPGPAGNFPLVPGAAYLVGVTDEVTFIPSHY